LCGYCLHISTVSTCSYALGTWQLCNLQVCYLALAIGTGSWHLAALLLGTCLLFGTCCLHLLLALGSSATWHLDTLLLCTWQPCYFWNFAMSLAIGFCSLHCPGYLALNSSATCHLLLASKPKPRKLHCRNTCINHLATPRHSLWPKNEDN
jgi:hypothetical protein